LSDVGLKKNTRINKRVHEQETSIKQVNKEEYSDYKMNNTEVINNKKHYPQNNHSGEVNIDKAKYVENYYNINKGGQFEKYGDLANYQKIVSENVSQILNNSISKISNTISNNNSNYLQTYLGIKKKK
jgi:hypothetical protein